MVGVVKKKYSRCITFLLQSFEGGVSCDDSAIRQARSLGALPAEMGIFESGVHNEGRVQLTAKFHPSKFHVGGIHDMEFYSTCLRGTHENLLYATVIYCLSSSCSLGVPLGYVIHPMASEYVTTHPNWILVLCEGEILGYDYGVVQL